MRYRRKKGKGGGRLESRHFTSKMDEQQKGETEGKPSGRGRGGSGWNEIQNSEDRVELADSH